jgi:23S rRNA pseudouridine1911/1915/1917 synthase
MPVMRVFRVSGNEQIPLIEFLASKLQVSKRGAKRLLDAKRIFVNGQRLWMAQAKLKNGDKVEVQEEAKGAVVSPNAVLYEDEEFLIYNKPPGILTNGPESLESKLRETLNIPGLLAVHRLDKDTSGCVLFARTRAIKEKTEEVFRAHQVKKYYQALVLGWVEGDIEEIKKPIDGKNAVTKVEVVSANDHASHLKLSLITGRTHQIRKHLAFIRHPIIGDKDYNTEVLTYGILRNIKRQMLHASHFEFQSPFSGKNISVSSPAPQDFRNCLEALKLS